MTDETQPPDGAKAESARAETARLARQQREAQALRDNLRRRKQQSRARTAPSAGPATSPPPRDDGSST